MKLNNPTDTTKLAAEFETRAMQAKKALAAEIKKLAEGSCLDWCNSQRIVQEQTAEGLWSIAARIVENKDEPIMPLIEWAGRKYDDVKRHCSGSRSTSDLSNAIKENEVITIRDIVSDLACILEHYTDASLREIEIAIVEESSCFGSIL